MNYQDHANALRDAADALEDAQRALNHLESLAACWYDLDDDERLMLVQQARTRLDGTWIGTTSRSLA